MTTGKKESGHGTADREIVITRVFDAPRQLVWKAITDPIHMREWYMTKLEKFEAKVGFQTQFTIHHHGVDYQHLWKVTEVVPGQKITYSWKYAGFPGESFATFELSDEQGKTRLKLTHEGLHTFQPEKNPGLATDNFREGWASIVSDLQEFLEKRLDGSARNLPL